MAEKTKKISTLIESQLPGFISSEYENFSKFVEKYYEQLESTGKPLDIIHNINKYRDINYYEKNLLNQKTVLTESILNDATSITVEDASSFPKENGYIRIGNEICFYKERTDTEFLEVSRGVSGNTTLGDLYNSSEFVTTQAAPHYNGDEVFNISNLFLYAFIKNFEEEYLGAFPEKYLKGEVDKRTLIKNINKFYKAKGTNRSISFIFNSIVSQDPEETVEVYNPKDFTLKASVSDWVTKYSLKVKVLSGDPLKLIGNIITQSLDDYDRSITFASAVVDNVLYLGKFDDEDLYEIILSPTTVNGNFKVAARTTLRTNLSISTDTKGRIDIFSSMAFPKQGKVMIGSEIISFNDKNVNQLIIDNRPTPASHTQGTVVYSYSTIKGTHEEGSVELITLGILYNLLPENGSPYSESGDLIQISESGFETRDPIIFDIKNNATRWFVNTNFSKVNSVVPGVNSQVGDLNADVSAIYEDDQYYYIASSSFPSHNDLLTLETIEPLSDQKLLKLIRKYPTTTTEVYETSNRDVGILVDGSLVYGYKDFDFVAFGKIETATIESKGTGYAAPPTVLINEQPEKALSVLSGETVNSISIISDDVYDSDPSIRITSGEGAKLSPVVTEGRISSINVVNPGRYYSSPPRIRIIDELGKGNFAEYEAILDNEGRIARCRRISGGRFYTRGNVIVTVEAQGRGAQATAKIKRWVKNRYEKLKNNLDTNNSYVFPSFDGSKDYGYGVVANPVVLRRRLNDSISAAYEETVSLEHSPIIGYAYDGNPIYGPYGFSDPVNAQSSVVRLSSGYVLKSLRLSGPSITEYPLGTFVDDYQWIPSVNSGKTELDPNNGRFCVTPDYPNGVYAYFLAIDENNAPQFPYVLGKNFYSLPVDSNYNSKISQDDLPLTVKRLKTEDFEVNGKEFYGYIQDVKSGNVSSAIVYESPENFSVNSVVAINDFLTEGGGASAIVSSVKGKQVVSIESNQTKAVQFTTIENAYLFEGDVVTQEDTDASGILIRDVINENKFVLRDVQGQFNTQNVVNSETKVITLILDKNSIFTQGATVTLTDGKGKEDSDLAVGEILEGITRQNSLKVKVISGEFVVNSNYFLKSSNLGDTSRAKILNILSLSQNLSIFDIDDNIAIVETNEPHNIAIGDKVNVDILPNDVETETSYYVRKRLYQEAILGSVNHSSIIVDTGVGSADVLNSGSDYETGTYENVELIFQDISKARRNIGKPGDSRNAKATIIVSNQAGLGYGGVASIILTNKGSGYKTGDILTVKDSDLNRLTNSGNNQRLYIVVDHVGFAEKNTLLKLSNVRNLSTNDYLKLNEEIVKITSVNVQEKTVTVLRGQKNTRPKNHYDKLKVELFEGNYRFNQNYKPFGEGISKPSIVNYDPESRKISVTFNYGAPSPERILQSSSFFDSSTPAKLVTIRTVEDAKFKLEFSKDNEENLVTNPIVDIQKYYKYKFDTSHFSMIDTYLDFSSSLNYNVFTEEKFVSSISPGNPGSFVTIKLGFGPNISTNTFQTRQRINFSNYFYFIKVSPDVNTDNSFLRIIDDPLIGEKIVTYTTNNKFVYSLNSTPEYDGSGVMSYTTTSEFAIGSINSISITNTGNDYKKIPVVEGVVPSASKECIVDVVYDSVNKNVSGFKILTQGSDYTKPKVVVVDGDGVNYEFECFTFNGKITKIDVLNKGQNFTYKPTVKIVESAAKIYLTSNTIGVPQNVKIINNGVLFNSDKTTLPQYKSTSTFILEDFSSVTFYPGEIITQPSTGAKARVAKNGWREGSNLLKVDKIQGVFELNSIITGKGINKQATLVQKISTSFLPEIKSYFDNLGFYSSDKGKIGANSQRLTDSYFYQDYSYVVKSNTSIDVWRELIKETTHPAGFQLFGEMKIDSEGEIIMPEEQHPVQTFVKINLDSVNVTVIDTTKQITNSFVNLNNLKIERGVGAVSVDTFDSSETLAYRVKLSAPFDGDYDYITGRLKGTRSFTLIDVKTNLPLVLDNSQQLFVSLDGVFQEPGVAYEVFGSEIIFATAPLGIRIVEGQEVSAQHFYAKAIKFKDSSLSSRYFRKIQSIESQFDGVKKEFDLYYENGDIVKTDLNENLLVGLNGVIQNAKFDANTPFGNSYYILRSENPNTTDKIIFSTPPIDQEDLYDDEEIPSELKGYEKCFIHSISNYERFTIDSSLIEYRGGGPYLIIDEIENRVRKIDEPLYTLVFIDGVLQEEGKSYQIVGPNITFTSPLKKFISQSGEILYQKVSIILIYGRDLEKTLTFFDFEPDTYFNVIKLRLQGNNIYQKFIEAYDIVSDGNVVLYQGNNVIGKIKTREKISDNEIYVTAIGNNLNKLTAENLKVVDLSEYELETELVEVLDNDDTIYDWNVQFNQGIADFLFEDPESSIAVLTPTINARIGKTLNLNINNLFSPLAIVDKLKFESSLEYEYTIRTQSLTFTDPEDEETTTTVYYIIIDEIGNGQINNPTIVVTQGDIITFNLETNDRPITIVQTEDLTLETSSIVTTNIENNGATSGTIIWDTSLANTNLTYYYVNLNNPSQEYGQIIIAPYQGSYWDEQNEVTGDFITNNGADIGIISWQFTNEVPTGTYYYVSKFFPIYGIINVLSGSSSFVPVTTSSNLEYPIEGSYTIDAEYLEDSEGNRLLAKDLPDWLFNSDLGDKAWAQKARIYGNLQKGDKVQIDGEFDFREILYLPNYAQSRNYNNGKIVSNEIYSKIKATNYNGITRGEGLSITAILSRSGSINSLSVSGLNWNKRDLNLYFNNDVLLQPTAYQYYTNPVVYFIPVDGNGGGAKAEVISHGGQILDVVLTDGGFGYTQPPRVIVARRYNRIKEHSRKIDSLTVVTVNTFITGFELISSSIVEITGAAGAEQAISSIITLGGFVGKEAPQRDITTIITPKPKILATSQKKFISELRVQSPTVYLEYELIQSYREITSIIDAKVDIISSSTVQSVSRELTKRIKKIINNAIIEVPSEAINDIGAFLDAPLSETDTIVYIPDTRRFPDASRLLIGKEIVLYGSKLPDRFLNVIRGAAGTTATTHEAGDYLRHLPELVSIVPVGPATIIITEVTITEVHNTDTAVVQVISTTANDMNFVSMSEISDIEIEAEYQINVDNSDVNLIKQITIIPPTTYLTSLNSYSSTYVSFVSAGAVDEITQISSIVNTISDVDIEITNTCRINVDNTRNIISTQIVTSAESSIESVFSTVQTIVRSDTVITNNVQIDTFASYNTYSSIVVSVQETSVSSIALLNTTIVSTTKEIVSLTETTELSEIIAISSVLSLVIAGVNDQINSIIVSNTLAKNADIEIFYNTGSIDYFEESVVLVNPIKIRTGEIILDAPINEIILRNFDSVFVDNKPVFKENFYDSYNLGNAGFTLKTFQNNAFVNTGSYSVNGSIESLTFSYPALTIKDFEERPDSSFTLSGAVFNLGIPSINSAGTFLSSNINNTQTSIFVTSTKGFSTKGTLLIGKEIISYTGKTQNSFTGVTRGIQNTTISSHSSGDYLRTFD